MVYRVAIYVSKLRLCQIEVLYSQRYVQLELPITYCVKKFSTQLASMWVDLNLPAQIQGKLLKI